ncbi:extensin family protein [Rhizobium rhizosphaerae]|nr:extensin family protein [Xaviernesmea rhizosphaerae]
MRHRPSLAAALLLPVAFVLTGAGLPENGPLPPGKPVVSGTREPAPDPAEVPKPVEKPADASAAPAPAKGADAPARPTPKPDMPADGAADTGKAKDGKPAAEKGQKDEGQQDKAAPEGPGRPAPGTDKAGQSGLEKEQEGAAAQTPDAAPALTIAPEPPEAHAQCIKDLTAIGARFEERGRIDDGKGCGIDKPISLTAILPGVEVAPAATLRCEAALELARWVKDSVLPAAKVAMAEDGALTRINQASSYVCRLRNNAATGKISEHARGNAIDIASFTFRNGQTIAIQPRDEDGTLTGAFQRAVTATGCLYFETVLDPGSDEAHEDHLHLDILQRKADYRYCR